MRYCARTSQSSVLYTPDWVLRFATVCRWPHVRVVSLYRAPGSKYVSASDCLRRQEIHLKLKFKKSQTHINHPFAYNIKSQTSMEECLKHRSTRSMGHTKTMLNKAGMQYVRSVSLRNDITTHWCILDSGF